VKFIGTSDYPKKIEKIQTTKATPEKKTTIGAKNPKTFFLSKEASRGRTTSTKPLLLQPPEPLASVRCVILNQQFLL
jgi:hypothetical protein